ncbi:Cytosolic sulfotransferase 5 [Raphanus sativus]|nr:Cytosolic sulfotransferase 5 [Raphanus sativus]
MDPKELPSNLRDDKISEETRKVISSLPSHTDYQGHKICKYQGCWYYYNTLQGTTWLKALTVALLERSKNHSSDHPLLYHNPHGIIPFLEIDVYHESSSPNLAKFSAPPRLFSTHMPLHTIHEALKHSPCKIVYVCRNVKDTLISCWFYSCAIYKIEPTRRVLESMFNEFCDGTNYFGPFWDHLLSYWRGSLEDPKHVLFMRYEEMKAEPRDQIKRLADFLGCPFTKQEEDSGSVDGILDLCSLRNLSSLEANKTGTINNVEHKFFFRKGEVDFDPSEVRREKVFEFSSSPTTSTLLSVGALNLRW